MSRPAGLPKTGGRKAGTPNRSTLEFRERLAALHCDPLQELITLARDPETTREERAQIYHWILPFRYPKPKPVDEIDEKADLTENISREEALQLARDLLELLPPELSPSASDGKSHNTEPA